MKLSNLLDYSNETNKLMTHHLLQTIRPSQSNATQRQEFDAIGSALKHRKIDLHNAAELSDLVKAGRLDEASMQVSDTPNN